MITAIASGKGGTGKTTVSVNLARVLSMHSPGKPVVQVIDCDVEEPNVHLFLDIQDPVEDVVYVQVPQIVRERCNGCQKCSEFCRFNAIISAGRTAMVFPEMCHSCGGCALVCPENAIRYVPRRIGVIVSGHSGNIQVVQGRLDIGVAMAPPLIRAVQKRIDRQAVAILDSPPGTSCPVIATLRFADKLLLVTEPTPFGLNDLSLAVDVARELGLSPGVVINRAGSGDDRVESFCRDAGIDVITAIPERRDVAMICSNGQLMVDQIPDTIQYFDEIIGWLGLSVAEGGPAK